MRSPIHPDTNLVQKELEPGFSAFACPTSGGVWIPLQNYLDWQSRQPKPATGASAQPVPELADDSEQRVLICPESGRLLLRYRVGRGLQFRLDRSPATGGVWLDRGEWEALKAKGLHTGMHLIFTAAYQRTIRSEQYGQTMEQSFRDRIGNKDFPRVMEIKNWLEAHPRRREICCYLLNAIGTDGEQPSLKQAD